MYAGSFPLNMIFPIIFLLSLFVGSPLIPALKSTSLVFVDLSYFRITSSAPLPTTATSPLEGNAPLVSSTFDIFSSGSLSFDLRSVVALSEAQYVLNCGCDIIGPKYILCAVGESSLNINTASPTLGTDWNTFGINGNAQGTSSILLGLSFGNSALTLSPSCPSLEYVPSISLTVPINITILAIV